MEVDEQQPFQAAEVSKQSLRQCWQ